MKSRVSRMVLLAAALAVAVAPVAALSTSCADETGGESCELDCALCLCCWHVRTVLGGPGGGLGPWPAESVGAEPAASAQDPLPRDVLHVPKSAPSR